MNLFVSLVQSDYNFAKARMRFFEYNFRIEIDSNQASLDRNIGLSLPQNQSAVSVERVVAWGGDNAVFKVWVFH